MPGPVEKSLLLARLALRHPVEAADRLRAILEYRLDPWWPRSGPLPVAPLEDALRSLEATLGAPIARYLDEAPLRDLEVELRGRQARLARPFAREHDGDVALGRVCYALGRALRPAVTLETGVAYGITTAFLLCALEQNRSGVLHSIDLPPLARGAERHVGALVPDALRARWHLHRGTSRRVLPGLLPRLPAIGLFVHDSLHTFLNVRDELRLVGARLDEPAAVVVDDANLSAAPGDWAAHHARAVAWVPEQHKRSVCAVAITARDRPRT